MPRDLRRAVPGYVLGLLLLAAYGDAICPYMHGQGAGELLAILGGGFALALAIEWIAHGRLAALTLGRRWNLQWGLWLVPGLFVTAWNVVVHQFPISSGLKMTAGSVAVGLFASCDRSLRAERERILAGEAKPEGETLLAIADRVRGFVLRATLMVGIVVVLFTAHYAPGAMRYMAATMAVLGIGLSLVIGHYRRYMRTMFEAETRVLDSVAAGDLTKNVPVVSRDEFGEIANRTNQMIDGLRERERIRSAFGKFVDPKVASKLLAAGEIKLGGEHREVAILFADLRGYTALSEKLSADQVVTLLNQYFTRMVGAISAHGGRVDKFIGDAVMAEYGLFGEPEPCDAALRTALAMRDSLRGINADLARRGLPAIDNGIGIHFGTAVAGQIGSDERLEYTVIGDCVNVAARLETLTRKLESPLAVSAAAYEKLPDELRRKLVPVGEHELKGKSLPVAVYGIARATDERRVVTAG